MPAHIITALELNDVIKLGDVYYNINSMKQNLTKGTVDFELVNFVRELSDTTPPIDTSPPVIGDLWVVGNPDTTAPTIGTLSYENLTGDSVILNWTAATDDVGVDRYDIFQDTVLVKTVDGSVLSTKISGLANSTEYDFYITASDEADNESANSNTVTLTTLDINAPVITNSYTNWWYVPTGGQYHELQINATNSPNLYDATNVPAIMSFSSVTGKISGTPSPANAGNYIMQVRASNNGGTSWGEFKDILIAIIPT